MPKHAPLAVEKPAPDRDGPGWIKVGVIAAVGFLVGVAWPRVLGGQLGSLAPGSAAAASASAEVGRAPDAPLAAAPAEGAPEEAEQAAPPVARAAAAASTVVTVNRGTVLSCKTADGETKRGKDCGSLQALDGAVLPRLRQLSTCTGLQGRSGKLSVVVTADFESARVSHSLGKSTDMGKTEPLEACLQTALEGLSTSGLAHAHARYTVAYLGSIGDSAAPGDLDTEAQGAAALTGDRGAAPEGSADPAAAAASGEAEIAWDVALVRETPKTGAVVGRLPRGTRVKLGTAKDGWYLVKFGDGFAREGWLYRGALGR